jgi:hypothetical protein
MWVVIFNNILAIKETKIFSCFLLIEGGGVTINTTFVTVKLLKMFRIRMLVICFMNVCSQISRKICGNKMPTGCNRCFYCISYCLLNMFRAPLGPSSGDLEYYTGGCCLWCLVLWFSSCRYGVELRVMCPVCPKHAEQAISSAIKIICCIQLACYFHILTTMHGQNHIKFTKNSSKFRQKRWSIN